MKTSDLTGPALDWAVCEAAGLFAAYPKVKKNFLKMWQRGSTYYIHPSSDPAQAYPIIEREIGNIWKDNKLDEAAPDVWHAAHYRKSKDGGLIICLEGPTLLVAAMRCFVASKLGDEVEIPEALK